ncbi:MAG TPA: AI-2E family transporter [Sedimenticola sp.]|nr:AI-2E family transporter [Sedimenticola sp.]
MPESRKSPGAAGFLVTAAAFVILVAGMREAQPILVPFLLSVFIAIIAMPPLVFLQHRRIPRGIALALVIAGVAAVGMLLEALVGGSVDDFSARLPAYQAKLETQTAGLLDWLGGIGVEISREAANKLLDPAKAMKMAAQGLSSLGGMLTNAFLILLTVIFILLEASSFPSKLQLALDDPQASFSRLEHVTDNIKRYMAIKTLTSLLTGLAVAAWLWVIGVDYPVLWGTLAFLLNYVPNIGSIIAAIPALLLALVQLGPGAALWSGMGYLVVNGLVGNIIEPRFMGRGLGLSTLVVFLSLVFWGWVLGPVGMFLSVPLTMTVKIALDSSEETRWIAILLGSKAEGGRGQTT